MRKNRINISKDRINTYVHIWAGIATISLAIVGLIEFANPPKGIIRNTDDLVKVLKIIIEYSKDVETNDVSPEQSDSINAAIKDLNESLNRFFPKRLPGTASFALKQGDAVELVMPSGDTEHFTMGRLYAVHSYTYAGIYGENRQLRVGERVEFGPVNAACNVQLVSINADQAEASFRFDC